MFFPGTFNIFVPGDKVFMLFKCMVIIYRSKKIVVLTVCSAGIQILKNAFWFSTYEFYSCLKVLAIFLRISTIKFGVIKKKTMVASKHEILM